MKKALKPKNVSSRKNPKSALGNCDEIAIESTRDKELLEDIRHQLELLAAYDSAGSDTQQGDGATSVRIVANVDVGFGNTLYIRGSGCGLSWDHGTEMKSVDGDHWIWECHCQPGGQCFEFKVLVNDQVWSGGENYLTIGRVNEIKPYF
jgi:hypothetical protein